MTATPPAGNDAGPEGRSSRSYAIGLLCVLGAVTVARGIFAAATELTPDEAYYWTWSRQLAAGYYDHPPMVALLIRLGTLLLGPSALGVRLFAVLSGFFVSWMLFINTRRFTGSARQGFWVALLATATPILSVGAVVHTPDAALGVAFSLVIWFGLRLFQSNRLLDWAGLGAAVGFAILSKGTGWVLLPALAIFFLGCQVGRERLKGQGPILMVLVALLLALPNLVWNTHHTGGSLRFQLHHAFANPSFSPLGELGFLGGQAGVVSPLLWAGLLMFAAVGFRRRVRNSRPEAFFLWCLSGPLIFGFAVLALLRKVEANWPAVSYLAALSGVAWSLCGGWWYLRRLRLWVASAGGLALVLTALIHLQVLCPFIPADPAVDPTARLRGWKELATEASADAEALGAVLAAEGYATASELIFYTGQEVLVEPSATRTSQFDVWELGLPRRALPERVLLLQPKTTPGAPQICSGAKERWQLLKEPAGARFRRAMLYNWWVCEGLRMPEIKPAGDHVR